ncbi:MAG: protein kinase [Gemmataceae bacterium]
MTEPSRPSSGGISEDVPGNGGKPRENTEVPKTIPEDGERQLESGRLSKSIPQGQLTKTVSIDDLPAEAIQRLEHVCSDFEEAWQHRKNPQVDNYLQGFQEPERSVLLQELLVLELTYLCLAGESPDVDQYRSLYPHITLPPLVELQAQLGSFGVEQAQQETDQDNKMSVPAERHKTLPVHAKHGIPFTSLPAFVGRYKIVEELARGGMGVVLRGQDPNFRRDLAIKVLLREHNNEDDLRRRFHNEAQIMAQLQHPGIPAVHETGEAADGLPYFTMKLIQGKTLAELLLQRTSPTDELLRYVLIFESVCQTLAYAHTHGIIHRDLKPRNIMVGPFGEVQVLDWGLAKIVEETASEDHPNEPSEQETWPLASAKFSQKQVPSASEQAPNIPDVTEAGQIMGTPAYMAPEQAKGLVRQVNERSDVFGLGAILCEILIGRPPYHTGSPKSNQTLAEAGELSDVYEGLDQCGADEELIQLCKECLAPQQADRPSNAQAVAARLADYEQQVRDRLQQAEVEQAQTIVRLAEERKRRVIRRQRTGILALLLLAVLVLVFNFFRNQHIANRKRQLDDLQRAFQAKNDEFKEQKEIRGARFLRIRQSYQAMARGNLANAQEKLGKDPIEDPRMVPLRPGVWELSRDKQLNQVKEAILNEDVTGAELALRESTRLLNDKRFPDLEKEREQTQKDLELSRKLRDIRLEKLIGDGDQKTRFSRADENYARAFQEAELPLETLQDRLRKLTMSQLRRPFATVLVLALYDWAYTQERLVQIARETGSQFNKRPSVLFKIAQRGYPRFIPKRLRIREVWNDPKKLITTIFASRIGENLSLSQFYVLEGRLRFSHGKDTGKLLDHLHRKAPAAFWINILLAQKMMEENKPHAALRHYDVSLAACPSSKLLRAKIDRVLSQCSTVQETTRTRDQTKGRWTRIVPRHNDSSPTG